MSIATYLGNLYRYKKNKYNISMSSNLVLTSVIKLKQNCFKIY